MKESDEYRLGRSAALRGESMAKYQSLTARMNPKKRAAFVQGYFDGQKQKEFTSKKVSWQLETASGEPVTVYLCQRTGEGFSSPLFRPNGEMFVGIETDSGFWVAEAPVDDTEVEELKEMAVRQLCET